MWTEIKASCGFFWCHIQSQAVIPSHRSTICLCWCLLQDIRSQLNLNQPFLLISTTSTYSFSYPSSPWGPCQNVNFPKIARAAEENEVISLERWSSQSFKTLSSVPLALFHHKADSLPRLFQKLALFHSLAESYANKFKRINKRLINMSARSPWAAEINSSGEQRIWDIWRTLEASTFLSVTELKQLVLDGQLVTFSVGSQIKCSA